ncbi:preprotein translocase subunit SecA [Negativibacillus massiliensis]|uniref:preprotein translocase subunit SecA n=1 Tax=Negativibacillus massiliensis TaxID=1871035 RepID=UPI00033D9B37|nr:preprotein translocase subunit SecA [Negativibacillus massiliensis]MDY4047206.1 preprotein translocase subunit SecA [Negativibacillus massiliensis]CDA79199.1 protein translocase subunit SecA [Clostridium sp. CAG:242]
MGLMDKIFGTYSERELKRIYPIRDKVLSLEEQYSKMSDKELKDMTPKLKERLANGETLDDILPDAFATCREAAWRVLGMKHFPVQIIGGIVLHQGRIAEMKTGEGKTLVATLPVYLNALTGKGVHVVTVNDYLAKRDSEEMGKVYRWLGLKVGLVIHDIEPAQRQEAYKADITYGTNNEFGFDYLRDNMQIYKENRVQRGHYYAVVDEVDSILIDEARTPLIISGRGDKSTDLYKIADRFARSLRMYKVKELDDKEEHDDVVDADYIVDEKAKTATLTKAGVKKAEEFFGLENLMDMENSTIQHHINQAIKAHGTMHRDINYVVKDGEVMIVDEFTGRIMNGRRYSEGLHQAIEAKEGVEVKRESKTLATITYQNLFRMYEKLSGMTGTAMTEEQEFREIYGMDVIEIPTNKPVIRKDLPDVVYKTENGKFNAVVEQVKECHEKGQPVLVGTVSIETSERLSNLLKRHGIKHQVLNAKYHEKEAEIVAQAGQYGAVTIATNMAGRGTDIMLGGNAEFLAKNQMRKEGYYEELIVEATGFGDTDNEEIIEARKRFTELSKEFKEKLRPEADKVREAGGLFIVGTERHESRRIDNQLRGRSGRQGDPGCSRFYLSLEDDLMRLFGGDRITNMMDSLKIDENMPIENRILTSTIENAQSKIEGRNFGIRKNVLQFDDVMNKQREIIYAQRNKVLDGENLKDSILSMMDETVDSAMQMYMPEGVEPEHWNMEGFRNYFIGMIAGDVLEISGDDLKKVNKKELGDKVKEKVHALYAKREEDLGESITRELERVVLLKEVDTKWMDHIDAMDELKKGISLRSYGQKDPVVEYRIEGFDMFDEMIASIREETVKILLLAPFRKPNSAQPQEAPKREQVAQPTATSSDGTVTPATIKRQGKKVGRNDPCPCGSGKKYKNCCGR